MLAYEGLKGLYQAATEPAEPRRGPVCGYPHRYTMGILEFESHCSAEALFKCSFCGSSSCAEHRYECGCDQFIDD